MTYRGHEFLYPTRLLRFTTTASSHSFGRIATALAIYPYHSDTLYHSFTPSTILAIIATFGHDARVVPFSGDLTMLDFLFVKKPNTPAMAEVLEDGRVIMNQEMQKAKYNDYSGAEPLLDILVRVMPQNEAPFEVKMKAGLTKANLLVPGVRVQVKYEATKKQKVVLDDELAAILARNPRLVKK